jgi:chromosome segregation protein
MYLKKLEIFGFKSFADRTTIVFEKGMTAIVGPNGCGKSNISDSIRWVLGEKSAKMLRGGKMEDLIFAGTQFRSPLGFAEISLTISNEDKLFPVEYEDVVLTRRLYRSGESEYLLNKTPCRLKDIQDLIMGTGMGSNAYSMVEQGQIDYIVQAKPHDRRFLIEEAAGISKYKHKKDEALRKLERTEHNIQRINDIILEVEKNIKYAERQARRAERFKEHFDTLKNLELLKAEIDTTRNQTELAHLQSSKELLSSQENDLQEKINAFQPRIDELDSLLREYEASQHELDEQRYHLKSEITSAQDSNRYNTEKISEIEVRTFSLDEEVILSTQKIESLESELIHKRSELEKFYREVETDRQKLEKIRFARENIFNEIAQTRSSIRECDDDLLSFHATMSEISNTKHSIKNEQTGLINKKDKNIQNLERLANDENDILKKIEIEREEIERILYSYNAIQNEFNEVNREKHRLALSITQLQEKTIEKRGALQEIDSKYTALQELAATLSPFKEGTKTIIDHSKSGNPAFERSIDTILDCITVSEGYEHAVQAVLAECLYALVVGSYSEAKHILNYSTEQNAGSIDIFIKRPVDKIERTFTHQSPDILGRLSEFVTINTDSSDNLHAIFDSIIVVSDFAALQDQVIAHLARHFNIVSLKGDVLTQDGVFRHRSESEFQSGALVQEERRKKLLKDKELVGHEIAILSEELQRYQTECENVTLRLEEIRSLMLDKKVALESNEKINSTIKENLSKIQEHKHVLNVEIQDIEDRLAELAENAERNMAQQCECENNIAEKDVLRQSLVSLLQEQESRRETIQLDIASAESTAVALREKEDYLKNSINIMSLSLQSENELRLKCTNEIASNKNRIVQLTSEIESAEEKLVSLIEKVESLEEEIAQVKAQREALTNRRDTELREINQYTKELEAVREELHAIKLREVEIAYSQTAIKERILQAYKIELDTFDFSTLQKEGVQFETLYDDVDNLKKKVEALGTVNLLAIEEYKELQERYTFLKEQHDDLENARRALFEAIRKINKTTKQLFIDVFTQVQQNFVYFYNVLFGGGIAKLILVDEENPLESGIDIIVQPPGKKLQHIGLLSGGEKAMTAVALLFSLFKVKPSPFCVLDEVDAPLDEANIDRFLNVVKEFSNNTQFIIVTHSRKTIKMAGTLFGVTMEEPGVSKLVSVRVADLDEKYISDPQPKQAVDESKIDPTMSVHVLEEV